MRIVNNSFHRKDPSQTNDSDITTAEIAGEIALFGKETNAAIRAIFHLIVI